MKKYRVKMGPLEGAIVKYISERGVIEGDRVVQFYTMEVEDSKGRKGAVVELYENEIEEVR